MQSPFFKIRFEYHYRWVPLRSTGRCKIEYGGPDNEEPECFVQHRRKLFGLPTGLTTWIRWDRVEWFDQEHIHQFKVDKLDKDVFQSKLDELAETGAIT